jgi:hypothetical protein
MLGDTLAVAANDSLDATLDIAYAALTGYIETLETPAGRTGILVARRAT